MPVRLWRLLSDMSASWGWVSVIDFAAYLHRIVEELQINQQESFEFHRGLRWFSREDVITLRRGYRAALAPAPSVKVVARGSIGCTLKMVSIRDRKGEQAQD